MSPINTDRYQNNVKSNLGPTNVFCITQDADLMNSVGRIRLIYINLQRIIFTVYSM